MKLKHFIFVLLLAVGLAAAFYINTSVAQQNAYEVINTINSGNNGNNAISGQARQGGGPVAGEPVNDDNPPDYRDPADTRKILDYSCTPRTKITTPGRYFGGWSCKSSMSCTCTMTYRDDSGRLLTCAASPMPRNLSGSGSDSDRNACIAEADSDLDSEREDFFQECRDALANCPP